MTDRSDEKSTMRKKNKTLAPITANQTVSQAFESILRHDLNYAVQWEAKARYWNDIEGVHQMRVAFRRMRSAMSVFRSAVPTGASATWSEELRWLGNQLGPARDLDVFIDESLAIVRGRLPQRGQEKLTELALRHRQTSYETVRAMLDNDRYAHFKVGFLQWLDETGWHQSGLKHKHRKRLALPIVPFARRLLDRVERQVLEAGSHVDRESQKEMHRLRIKCKQLRYATEFFSPLFKGMETFIQHMKGLQDLLGNMNDVYVMRQLLVEILGREADPEACEYAGGLIGWRLCDYEHQLKTFDERWDEFVEARNPWWSKGSRPN